MFAGRGDETHLNGTEVQLRTALGQRRGFGE